MIECATPLLRLPRIDPSRFAPTDERENDGMALNLRGRVDSLLQQLLGEMLMARGTVKVVVSDQTQPFETPFSPLSDEQIAQRAYFKWQARGCPMGEDLQDWLEAQDELRTECEQAHVCSGEAVMRIGAAALSFG